MRIVRSSKERNSGSGKKIRYRVKEKKKMSLTRKILTGILVFLIIVAASLGGYYWYLVKKGEEQLKISATQNGDASTPPAGTVVNYDGKDYVYNDNIINILCIGIDKSTEGYADAEIGAQGLADSIFLVSLNVEDNTVKVLAIPRDTMVPVEKHTADGKFEAMEKMQLTLQYEYGLDQQESCELMEKTVSTLLYGLPIARYISFNMAAIPPINDAVGGVDVTVLEDVNAPQYGTYLSEGEQVHLEGQSALAYVRVRDVYKDQSSLSRLERQKQYLLSFFPQLKKAIKADLSLPLTLYNTLSENMVTDLSTEDVTYLATEVLGLNFSSDDMLMLPGEATRGEQYLEYYPNEEELKKLIIDNYYIEMPSNETNSEKGDAK